MKKIISLVLFFLFTTTSICNAQGLMQQKGFVELPLFRYDNQPAEPSLRAIATDVQHISVDYNTLQEIQTNRPEFIQFQVIHHTDTLDVKLQRHDILTEDFILRNQSNEPLNYQPGLYYRGIVNDDRNSLAAFNFFRKNLNGVVSEPEHGNRVIGELKDAQDYVIYSDTSLTETPNFECKADQIEEIDGLNQQFLDPVPFNSSTNCVKLYYELTHDLYIENAMSVTTTMDWLTSVHNVVSTLYSNAGINTDLSDVLIWQEPDPYEGDNLEKLIFFRENRIAFNGDVGHLLDVPVTGGVAYLDGLCSTFRHGFSGLELAFNQLPIYSWTVVVIAHELGHSLGSPHTHACFWNGNNTAIDSCGPAADLSEGCDEAPIPPFGGTVMSYCHLNQVGVNLSTGFHPQVANHIINTIDNKACLGTDCIDSCMYTVAALEVDQTTENAFTVQIEDVISNSWDYTIYEFNSYPDFTTTTNNTIDYTGVFPNEYYSVRVFNNCTNGNYGSFLRLNYLSEADWCSGVTFSEPWFNQFNLFKNFTKTFYPSSPDLAVQLEINEFNLFEDVDFMTIYDGESTDAPVFAGAENLTGSEPETQFFEATNQAGAITVEYVSDFSANNTTWDMTISCETLTVNQFTENEVLIYPNPVQDIVKILSAMPLDYITVFDIQGKKVLQQKTKGTQEENLSFIDMETGVYFIQLSSGEQSIIQRVIKE